LIAALAPVAALLFFISQRRYLDPDELESLYASWLISKGQLVYRDFYQIHTPLAYYLFAPVFFFYNSLKVIGAARAAVFVLVFLNGALLFKISRRLFNYRTAAAGLLFFLTSWPVFYKMVEIRPDIFVAIFSNLALIALFSPAGNAPVVFFLAGVCSGLAVLAKQSGLVFFILLAVFFLFRLFTKNSRFWQGPNFSAERFNLKTFLLFMAGFLSVISAFFLILHLNKADSCFFAYSVNNDFFRKALLLRTEAEYWLPFKYIKDAFYFNPGSYLFALVLFPIFFISPNYRKNAGAYVFMLFLVLGCFGALFLILHPWGQELILPAQYLSVLAGGALIGMFEYVNSGKIRGFMRLVCLFVVPAVIIFNVLIFLRGVVQESMISVRNPDKYFGQIIALTNENDKCVSVHYPCLFRPSGYFYRIGTNLLESPSARKRLDNALSADIRRGDVKIIFPIRKLDKMPGLKELIEKNYITRSEGFFIPGVKVDLSGEGSGGFDILVEGWYRILCLGNGVTIDGQDAAGKTVYLKMGRHQVNAGNGSSQVSFAYDFKANRKTR